MTLATIFAVVTTDVCLAASMPDELRGEYTFGSGDQCGYLKIDAKGFGSEEDLSCTDLAVKKVSGSPGENSSFQAEFLCQVGVSWICRRCHRQLCPSLALCDGRIVC
jgi:hypothetical protein